MGSGEGGEGEGGTLLGLPELDTDVDVSVAGHGKDSLCSGHPV